MQERNERLRSELCEMLTSLKPSDKDKNVQKLISLLKNYDVAKAEECKQLIQMPSVKAAFKKAKEQKKASLISEIGDYNLSVENEKVFSRLLGDKALVELYKTAKKEPIKNESKKHREEFINFLLERQKEVEEMNTSERDELIAQGEPEEAAITLQELLTSRGVNLYKKALEEECNSKEYLKAVFVKSIKHFEGKKWKYPVAIPIGGPSGCGKSYSQKFIVDGFAEGFDKIEWDNSGNDVISIDGGNAREVSQIRKLVTSMANKKEYTFISDLTEQSTILDDVAKENIKNAAGVGKNRQPLNIVIPDTFSTTGAVSTVSDKVGKKLATDYFRDLSSIYKDHVYEARIVGINGADAPDPEVVEFNGVARSAKTDFTIPIGDYDLNIDLRKICESKAYRGGVAFSYGVEGSRKIEKRYKELFPKGRYINVEYDLILIGKYDDIWEKRDKSTTYKQVRAVSSRLFDAWKDAKLKDKDLTLEQFETEHKDDYKPIIHMYKCSEKPQSANERIQSEVTNRERTQEIIKTAEEIIEDNIDNLCFDPQGRVLIRVRPTDSNQSTTVSYDITDNSIIREKFLNKIKLNIPDKKVQEGVSKAYNKLETKSSIIPLQQEFHFHLRLALQVYKKQIAPQLSDDEFETIHFNTMKKVNSLVMKAFADGLVKSYIKDHIDIPELNKALDKARETILPTAHKILCEQFNQETNMKLKRLSKDSIEKFKHSAEIATATSDSLLHLDNKMGLATYISGTDVSSHDRDFGVEHLADMQTIAYSYAPKVVLTEISRDVLTEIPHHRTQVRVPSIAVKGLKKLVSGKVFIDIPPWIETGYLGAGDRVEPYCEDADFEKALKLASESEEIQTSYFIKKQDGTSFYLKDGNRLKQLSTAQVEELLKGLMRLDVMNKISHLSERYFVGNVESNESSPNVFVYNLYTSLNSGISGNIDEKRNLQNESLEFILTGAHQYNKTIAQDGDTKRPFCFVQAIAVNGFGDKLGYDKDTLHTEATLMTEMALLHTLSESTELLDHMQDEIKQLDELYNNFLQSKDVWFSRRNSRQAIELLKIIKDKLQQADFENDPPSPAKCLAKMFAYDKHFTNDARLIQALSIVTEKKSMSGCKSANERTQVVNSRVALFDSQSKELKTVMDNSMRSFLKKSNNIDKAFKDFERSVDSACNDHNLYGEYSLISLQSQGASDKAETGKWYDWDTNKIEASAAVMKNHNQAYAAKMQAHKGLADSMVEAILETSGEKTWKDNLKSLFVKENIWKLTWRGAALMFLVGALIAGTSAVFPVVPLVLVGGIVTLTIVASIAGGIGIPIVVRELGKRHQENIDEKISNETDRFSLKLDSNAKIINILEESTPSAKKGSDKSHTVEKTSDKSAEKNSSQNPPSIDTDRYSDPDEYPDTLRPPSHR